MPCNFGQSFTVDADIPYWRCIGNIKRDIKRLEKELKSKRQILNVYFTDICGRFNVTPDDSDAKWATNDANVLND